ncbi:hypothetical protein J4435_02400 [Candidatus Woesearchaeota archaeon]|nr:hypothetical protein [Candidatus Woesearchaeota archaeon]
MDVLAHYLWAYAIAAFAKIKQRKTMALFGVLPDFFSFGILMVAAVATGSFHPGKPELSSIPPYVSHLYDWTHSLAVFFAVFALVFLATKRWYLPSLGWAVHVLIDIPTHTSAFFPTPFLWPLSDYSFSGIAWSEPWFMLLNYSSLAFVYWHLAREHKKEKANANKHKK